LPWMMRGLVCLGRVVDADERAFLRVLRALVLGDEELAYNAALAAFDAELLLLECAALEVCAMPLRF